jgi:NAD(P)-dependent dehydrogenase (short-subunit alcohol dehydrogenase family)
MSTSSDIPFDANEFKSKRILVSGGTKGMGEAIVKRLSRAGGTVITTARSITGSEYVIDGGTIPTV